MQGVNVLLAVCNDLEGVAVLLDQRTAVHVHQVVITGTGGIHGHAVLDSAGVLQLLGSLIDLVHGPAVVHRRALEAGSLKSVLVVEYVGDGELLGQNRQLIRQVVLADDLQGLRLKDGGVNVLAQILELIGVQTGQTGGGQQIRQVVVLGHQGELGQLVIVGDDHDVNGVAGLVGPLVQGGSECIALAGLLRQHDLQGLAAGRSGAGSCGVRCCSGAGRRCSGRTAAGCQRSRHRGCQSQRKCFFHVGFTSCKVEIKIGYIHRALTRFAPFRGLGTGLSVPLVYP